MEVRMRDYMIRYFPLTFPRFERQWAVTRDAMADATDPEAVRPARRAGRG
jgi:hypothetical protein